MLNYTYYLKLKQVINDDVKIQQEKQLLENKIKDSLWGITKSQTKYIDYLDKIYMAKKSIFKKIKLRKISNELSNLCDKKIRVVFFVYEFATFPTFKTIYDKMK